jgi:hypothetical protein
MLSLLTAAEVQHFGSKLIDAACQLANPELGKNAAIWICDFF